MGGGYPPADFLTILVAAFVATSAIACCSLATAAPQALPVVFEPGSGAGRPDLGGKVIAVAVGPGGTWASASVNPTYQETYYRDVLRVTNRGGRDVVVYLAFTSLSNTLPPGSVVRLFFYDGDAKVAELDVTGPLPSEPVPLGTLASGASWQLDIYVYIPEGTSIAGARYVASAGLVCEPSPALPFPVLGFCRFGAVLRVSCRLSRHYATHRWSRPPSGAPSGASSRTSR